MGSSTSRKQADRLRINRPMDASVAAGAAAGGGAPQDINNVCPPTIRVKLASQDVIGGAELLLDGSVLRLAAGQKVKVGTVPAATLKRLQTCLGIGIKYPTIRVVVDKQGVCHAEFAQ